MRPLGWEWAGGRGLVLSVLMPPNPVRCPVTQRMSERSTELVGSQDRAHSVGPGRHQGPDQGCSTPRGWPGGVRARPEAEGTVLLRGIEEDRPGAAGHLGKVASKAQWLDPQEEKCQDHTLTTSGDEAPEGIRGSMGGAMKGKRSAQSRSGQRGTDLAETEP